MSVRHLLFTLAVTLAPVVAVAADAPVQPEFKALKADFVPGEKTLLFDDFADMCPVTRPHASRPVAPRPSCRKPATSGS